ncbi:MAG TPA: carbohydrate ABC transporter permease [Candidatus Eisenbergiella merdipullorum]|uniref:Carbohydrate ABC transporter permease n=1 Tax=Candidatus Eisenbergiella merdipullorum TaxID=2838553 RepID=A0A9D2L0W2_9FIRM|nr:carbohydrate ABC transporter permease [Candidatus Eisenbergiella merdipullorum]
MSHKKKRTAWDDCLFSIIINVLLIAAVVVVAYPVYFILVASFSDPTIVNSGDLLFYPKGFTLTGYKTVFKNQDIWTGYKNTIFYTVCGTILGTMAVLMAGYALSRKDLRGRGIIMKLFVFTMYFSGGLIPFFLTVKSYGLLDSRLLMVILGSVSVYNIIVVRTFMQNSIPEELFDAATIDGCGNGRFFFRIVLPLSKAIIAVMILYIAVSYWNSYFNAMIFLTDDDKYPLQLVLRQILLTTSAGANNVNADPEIAAELQNAVSVIKYSIIIVVTGPILCLYPFIQKYFTQGVMIGAVKG